MIEIISGTDRPGSNSYKLAKYLERLYLGLGAKAQVLDLAELNLSDAAGGGYFSGARGTFQKAVSRVTESKGLVVVVPEYNGSYPGILKLFIDYWRYPESFEHRPIALLGVGNRWGGLRPVEHLQQVFGYRNAYVFPNRVFIHNISDALKEGELVDPAMVKLVADQARDFTKFIEALATQQLDAQSKLRAK